MIRGKDFALPLVAQIGVVRDHRAHRVTWHAHAGYELLFLLDGATTYEFQDGRTVPVPGGHFLVVGPKARHRGLHDVRMPSAICGIVLDPEPARHCRNTPFIRQDLKWLAERLEKSVFTIHPFNRDLRRAVQRLVAEIWPLHPGGIDVREQTLLRSLACTAVLEVAQQLNARRHPGPTELVDAAAAYLRDHCHEPIHMNDLVQRLGYSRARTFQLFKSGLGLTPNDFLQRVRIEKAQKLLRESGRSITEVALAAGFNSSQYFSTVFRRYSGCTPAEFRAPHRSP